MAGSLLLAPGTQPGTAALGSAPGALSVSLRTENGTDWPIQFEGSYSDSSLA